MKAKGALKRLFVSSTRQKLINTFFYNPKEIFYVRQLVRLVDEEINSVRRELENLKAADIISSEWRGNRLYYWTNPQNPIYYDLLILANKTSGLGNLLQEKKPKIGTIQLLFYSNYFITSQSPQPDHIDLIIVGKVSLKVINSLIKQEEEKRGREINYMVMDRAEFQMRKSKRDPFLVDFFLGSPVVIIGNPNQMVNL